MRVVTLIVATMLLSVMASASEVPRELDVGRGCAPGLMHDGAGTCAVICANDGKCGGGVFDDGPGPAVMIDHPPEPLPPLPVPRLRPAHHRVQ